MASHKQFDPRWAALCSLSKVVGEGRSLDAATDELAAEHADPDARDWAFYQTLTRGVCRWFLALRPVLKPYLRKSFKPRDFDLEVLIILGLYQIIFMRIDDHAAVNESVKLVRRLKKDWAKGLVNAVLRQLIRDGISSSSVQVMASYPLWMQDTLIQDWPQQGAEIAEAGNQRAPLCLRVDLRQITLAAALERLGEAGVAAFPQPLVESAIQLEKPCDPGELELFASGILSVQDAAAQLAAGLLDCRPGMRVLDACAAPGGKTAHLLQACDDLDLVALDRDSQRLQRVAQNLARIGREAQLVCGDAASWRDGGDFDRILADVPCSGSGVIRRHPDIKLLRRAEDIGSLVGRQREILSALWAQLKTGGTLLYSTCSIFKDENERQISWFVENHNNCAVKSLKSVQWGRECSHGRQILPGEHQMDGFYYACITKQAH